MMTAFKSLLVIHNINEIKAEENRKAKEKAEILAKDPTRKALLEAQAQAPKVEEKKEEEKKKPAPKGKKIDPLTVTQTSMQSELQAERERERIEIENYGRMWIWDGYYSPNRKEQWLQAIEKLGHVNDHVMQDIEDYIILQGFAKEKPAQVKAIIDGHKKDKRRKMGVHKDKDLEDHFHHEDKKREFFNANLRPPQCWNAFEEPDTKTPHILRHNAKPQECYIDGRIESIMEDIESIGYNLRNHEEARWKQLVVYAVEIFVGMDKQEKQDDKENDGK